MLGDFRVEGLGSLNLKACRLQTQNPNPQTLNPLYSAWALVHMHIYIYIYIYTHTSICMDIYIYTHMCIDRTFTTTKRFWYSL